MYKILIVDDEKHIRFLLRELLEGKGYDLLEAKDGKLAIEMVKKEEPEVILLDFKLPDTTGEKILQEIKKINSNLKVIILTAYADIKRTVTCMRLGAFDYLTKPFDNNEIVFVVQKALKEYQMENELIALRNKILKNEISQNMMGESAAIKKVITQIELVAPTDISVFIEGETGTGKEVVANLIHKLSGRADKPFVAVDCGAIPEALFESEMFGHEKGAFTGAIKRQIGKFEQADKGTLFLDEITNLPINMQSKLLRILQNKALTRIGSNRIIPIDVRIIAASNKNIDELVKAKEFRDDLFFRLNEFKIILPSLKERKEDILFLANLFIKEFSNDTLSLDSTAMSKLVNYSWPGNIRELRNVIKRALLLAKGSIITQKHLLFLKEQDNTFSNASSLEDITYNSLLQRVKIIKESIRKANGNKTRAAQLLGITRNQLYRTLIRAKEFEIDV